MYSDNPAQREHERQSILLTAYAGQIKRLRGESVFVDADLHEAAMIKALAALDDADRADASERKRARAAKATEFVTALDKAAAKLADNENDLGDLAHALVLALSTAANYVRMGEDLGGGLLPLRLRQVADQLSKRYQTDEEFEAANGAPRWALEAEADYRNR